MTPEEIRYAEIHNKAVELATKMMARAGSLNHACYGDDPPGLWNAAVQTLKEALGAEPQVTDKQLGAARRAFCEEGVRRFGYTRYRLPDHIDDLLREALAAAFKEREGSVSK